ncbi:MAG: glucuronate isomerase [Oscillospiraceae bacterium]|nr:glucuronate isomerase [Oscillospiraceae bacterium]
MIPLEDLFFTNETAKRLYGQYAKDLPIIDYHCHLDPREIAENKVFDDLGEMWLARDHYKWRAMRTFGIPERLITGNASYYDKFLAFAGIFPKLAGNPLYIWCRLELGRYFGIDAPLDAANAHGIYTRAKARIDEQKLTPRSIIQLSHVDYIATTDDPVDDLRFHRMIQSDASFRTTVVPAFRPDKAMNAGKPGFADYIGRLSETSGIKIQSFHDLMDALEARLLFFKEHGSVITDHGLDNFYFEESSRDTRDAILGKAMAGETLTMREGRQYQTAFLLEAAKRYRRHGFVMQLHIGAYRDANSRMARLLGPDSGFDCIDGETPIRDLGRLLNTLHNADCLPKTILYPLNIHQHEPLAALAAAFCTDGRKAGVILGAPWWFNDQPFGIRQFFESTGQLYPLSLSMGMLTDSRSFLSYPRHEVFRRILCDYLGSLVERGEYASGEQGLIDIIEAVCYQNVREYLGIEARGIEAQCPQRGSRAGASHEG